MKEKEKEAAGKEFHAFTCKLTGLVTLHWLIWVLLEFSFELDPHKLQETADEWQDCNC